MRGRSSRSNAGFNPSARQMASSAFADPNIMSYLFLCRGSQVEIDARICSSRFYSQGGFYRATFCNAHFIETYWQSRRVMAVDIRAGSNRRNLFPFLFKPDFGGFERTAIRAYDISLDGGGLR